VKTIYNRRYLVGYNQKKLAVIVKAR